MVQTPSLTEKDFVSSQTRKSSSQSSIFALRYTANRMAADNRYSYTLVIFKSGINNVQRVNHHRSCRLVWTDKNSHLIQAPQPEAFHTVCIHVAEPCSLTSWDRASLEQRSKKPTGCNTFSLLIYLNLLYFDTTPRYCCRPVTPVGSNIGALYQSCIYSQKCSWRRACLSPETCRADSNRSIKRSINENCCTLSVAYTFNLVLVEPACVFSISYPGIQDVTHLL